METWRSDDDCSSQRLGNGNHGQERAVGLKQLRFIKIAGRRWCLDVLG